MAIEASSLPQSRQGQYPFPPARVLYLVTKDAPSPAIKEFYTWVLNDGQQYVEPAGYVPLNAEQLAKAKALLESDTEWGVGIRTPHCIPHREEHGDDAKLRPSAGRWCASGRMRYN